MVGSSPALAGLCLTAVQQQLNLSPCGASAIDAWSGCYGSQHVSSPQPNDLVFFSAGASNGGFGHVGIVQQDTSTFWSELSDGEQAVCSIQGFAAYNGVSVLGYARVVGGSAPASSITSAISSPLPSIAGALGSNGGTILGLLIGGGLALAALTSVGDVLDDL